MLDEYISRFLSMSKEDKLFYTGIIESKMLDMGYSIKNFFVDECGLVTLSGSFSLTNDNIFGNDLSEKEYTESIFHELPVYFKKVTQEFILDEVPIKSLAGCPERVGGDLIINNTDIESLEGCPTSISGNCFVTNNKKLKEINFLPKRVRLDIRIYDNGVLCDPEYVKKHTTSFLSLMTDPIPKS